MRGSRTDGRCGAEHKGGACPVPAYRGGRPGGLSFGIGNRKARESAGHRQSRRSTRRKITHDSQEKRDAASHVLQSQSEVRVRVRVRRLTTWPAQSRNASDYRQMRMRRTAHMARRRIAQSHGPWSGVEWSGAHLTSTRRVNRSTTRHCTALLLMLWMDWLLCFAFPRHICRKSKLRAAGSASAALPMHARSTGAECCGQTRHTGRLPLLRLLIPSSADQSGNWHDFFFLFWQ